MTDGRESIRRILRAERLAESYLPAEAISALERARVALDEQGQVMPRALRIAVRQVQSLDIVGTATVVADAAPARRVPQSATKLRLDARAATPPSGGVFRATVYADGEPIGTVSIADGQETGNETSVAPIPAGAWLTLDVTAANSAAGIVVAITYRIDG